MLRYILTSKPIVLVDIGLLTVRSRGRGGAKANGVALRLACEAANRNWSLAEAEVQCSSES